jgi:subtilisin family serine protease
MESVQDQRDVGIVRRVPALVLAFVMVASIGVVPVQAVATAVAGTSALHWSQLANTFSDRIQSTADFGLSHDLRSFNFNSNGPVEMVVSLQGNSLAAEQAARIADGRDALDGAGQKAFVSSLKISQATVKASLLAAGVQILYEYHIVFNGFDVVADRATLSHVLSLPGVSHLEPVQTLEPALDSSVPFILGGKSYSALGADGTGTRIAIIDTGIDYTHADFGGSGNPKAYATMDPTIVVPGTFPTAKVIGGTDLVGEWYDANCPPVPPQPKVCSSIPMPDPNPIDLNGHGTHVAGIAAGMGTSKVAHGVAPGAKLLIYKIFALGSASSAVVAAAIEMATNPSGDGDTSDHVDVINMSLGSEYGRNTDLTAVASNAAVALGVIVVASAGNSGNLPYVTGSPAVASNAISIAAGNSPGVKVQLATVAGSSGANGDKESLEGALTVPLVKSGTITGPAVRLGAVGSAAARACSSLAAGSLTGKIPLIERGVCTFRTKILNAQAAGATAVVIYTQILAGEPVTMGGSAAGIKIPGVMIGNLDGIAVSGAISATTTFTLDPSKKMPIPNRLQGFTSRGPRFGDSGLKPDLTAPGGGIFSAGAGSGVDGVSLSGTSMASPHVAGAAALLRQLHPRWSVQEIKSALMNTATATEKGGVEYPVTLEGAGRVRVDVAAKTSSLAIPGSLALGVRESATSPVVTIHSEIQVRNKGTASKTFAITADFRTPTEDDGSLTLLHAASVTVGKGRTRTISFDVRVDFRLLPPSDFLEYDGFVTLRETTAGGDVLRVPFHVIPVARSSASASSGEDNSQVTLQNRGLADTIVDVYQLGVRNPRRDLIPRVDGMPKDPSDWFNIRAVGAHAFDFPPLGRVLEFGIATWGLRSVANMMVTEVWIDANQDGTPDYVVLVADLGLLLTGSFDPSGRMLSVVVELKSGLGFPEFIVDNPRNTAVQTAPILLDDLNFLGKTFGAPQINATNPTFSYFVDTTDLETGAMDVTRSATFNAIQPALDTSPNFLLLPAGASVRIDVLGDEGGLLVLFYGNVAGPAQSQIVLVGGHGDHEGRGN